MLTFQIPEDKAEQKQVAEQRNFIICCDLHSVNHRLLPHGAFVSSYALRAEKRFHS